ncbi:MAG: flagellar biosynthesis protein FlhA [Planctomycetaceae bacterium]|nr:flagellar biosynthesis protein FlhA [Planctomycetaceae bacterium]
MPPAASITARRSTTASLGFLFPMLLCASVLVIIAPLPAMLLDLLLAANITVAVLILLTTIYVRRPLEFSVFPAILLATTLSRLVLNVASTRLVLSRGAIDGELAAGGVIRAFGEFVAGGQIVIGLIIFAIILAIQFLVITKGATRISEVAARFALDGMPGRQMAIDADLNSGLITLEQARARRDEVSQQADFYGAMDGASKFVRGDAIAGLLITVINIGGGLFIGIFQHGMPVGQALEVFTKLTIGDGLVSQVPAFLISLAAGLIVTRSSTDSDLPQDIVSQLFRHPEALAVSACFLVGLSFTGLPAAPLLFLAAVCGVLAWSQSRTNAAEQALQTQNAVVPTSVENKFEDQLTVHPLELEIGYGLIRLTDATPSGDLLNRINRIRQKLAQELGLILPSVRISDNLRLKPHQYRIKLHGIPIATGDAYAERCLAINTDSVSGDLPGIPGVDPAFQRPAVWIEPTDREHAIQLGYHVVEAAPVVVTHLTEVIRRHSDELLSQQQVHQLLERLKKHSPRVVEDLIPGTMKVAQVHQILINLLRERVTIRNLETILETLASQAGRTQDIGRLTECVRVGLRRTICQQFRDSQGNLRVVTLESELEELLLQSLSAQHGDQITLLLTPHTIEAVQQAIDFELSHLTMPGHAPVVLCSPPLRACLRQLISTTSPAATVLSLSEITPDTKILIHGRVSLHAIQDAPLVSSR